MAELQFRMCKDDSLKVMELTYERCTAKKRVKDSEWFKENMLVAQAQEADVILQEEQQDFLADGLAKSDSNYDNLKLHTTSIFKENYVYAFDSDCDVEATANVIFMARLSPKGPVNGNDVGLTYDPDILFENDVAQSVPPPEHDNAMILFVIEQMQSQVKKMQHVGMNSSLKNNFETLKKESSAKQDKYIDEILVLEKDKKALETMIQRLDDEIVSLAFQIYKNAKLRAQSQAKFSETQKNKEGTSVNTKFRKPATSGNKRDVVTLIESEPINAYFKNNGAMQQDYLKVTKEHIETLQELLEQARALKPSDENLDYVRKFA
ncbi:hypothetical protein Tco_0645783 [Tanacetum coccineum]